MANRAEADSAPPDPPVAIDEWADLGDATETSPSTTPPPKRPSIWRDSLAVLRSMARSGYHHRITGLAAEISFFAILSLPPLLFGLAGSVGFVAQRFDVTTVAAFREDLVSLLSRVFTGPVLNQTVVPTLDDVFSRGRLDVLSFGFLAALWSGSRAVAVLAQTASIVYGVGDARGYFRSRALSIGQYLAGLFLAALLLPLVLAGPRLIDAVIPANLVATVSWVYWPAIVVVTTIAVAGLLHQMVPLRRRFRADLPGAVLTMILWIAAGYALRAVLALSLDSPTLYGPMAAPIALLVGVYVVALMILIGAALNAALIVRFPAQAGLTPAAAADLDLA